MDAVDEITGTTEYRRGRLELADLLRAALHVAHGRGDDDAEASVRNLLARLAEDQLHLAVVGQFSRGKSTLMNAMLGADYLPTGALPMTAVVTTVRYGSRPLARVRRRGGRIAVETPIGELPRYVARAAAERAELQVTSVDVEVPAELLRPGFALVDTLASDPRWT